MKIINQTESELVLQDGNFSSIFSGILFLLFAIFLGYQFFSTGSIMVLLMGGILFIVGLVIILKSSTIIIDFNKTSGQFNYIKKSLIKSKTTVYNFLDVLRIEVRKQWEIRNTSSGRNSMSTSRQVLVSQTVFVFKDGTELPLDHKKDSSDGFNLADTSAVLMGGSSKENFIANQVAIFLGVPFQEVTPPNTGSGINTVTIDGIKL